MTKKPKLKLFDTEETVVHLPAGGVLLTPEAFAKLPPEHQEALKKLADAGEITVFDEACVVVDEEDFREAVPDYVPPKLN